jgi:hypothetical protein
MNVTMIRAKVKDESIAEVEAAVKTWFAAIEQAQPKGVHYASCRLPDSATFVIMLKLDEGIENPLPTVPEFTEFQASLQNWLAEPPAPEQLTVIGSYNLF